MNTPPSPGQAARQRHIDALARRAATQPGPTQQLLAQRLATLRAAQHQTAPGRTQVMAQPAPPAAPRPLAELLAHIQRHAAAPGELRAVHQDRGTWSRLHVQHRLVQSLAQVPAQAGPLNTEHLLHQALTLMQSTSPDYLQHFMVHVEALLALER